MASAIFMVRHGLKIDFEDKNWVNVAENAHDPSLSQNGIVQANETA